MRVLRDVIPLPCPFCCLQPLTLSGKLSYPFFRCSPHKRPLASRCFARVFLAPPLCPTPPPYTLLAGSMEGMFRSPWPTCPLSHDLFSPFFFHPPGISLKGSYLGSNNLMFSFNMDLFLDSCFLGPVPSLPSPAK